MDQAHPDPVKYREIGFCNPHPDPQQALSAVLVLADIEGIIRVTIPDHSRNTIHVSYDLNQISLYIIEDLLSELGFHLDNSLLAKLKRALYYYTEENELLTLGPPTGQDQSTREIFMRCYQGHSHGCRDERPQHWRKYL
ncbi:MAG: hypothetical protein BMS9Abin08_0668 [Gammaproteobacteria bacterium]|nr:MAG: hypothetical protein BMS9Abin06_0584 [Gammaproteobacteria bacterium]GMQ87464.1 MAG: hypothetical protein BMS9Abin08_0668 [Gammaproteobacteria bacterium]